MIGRRGNPHTSLQPLAAAGLTGCSKDLLAARSLSTLPLPLRLALALDALTAPPDPIGDPLRHGGGGGARRLGPDYGYIQPRSLAKNSPQFAKSALPEDIVSL